MPTIDVVLKHAPALCNSLILCIAGLVPLRLHAFQILCLAHAVGFKECAAIWTFL